MRTDSGTSGLSRLEASHAAISAALLQGNVGIGVFLTGIVDQKSARKERLFFLFFSSDVRARRCAKGWRDCGQ